MRALFKIPIAVAAVVALLGGFLLTHDFDAPELGLKVAQGLRASTGVELSADSFALNLSRGLTLKGVRAGASLPSGKLTVRLEELVLDHELWPLLKGEVVVEEVVLERPVIELVSRAPSVEAWAPAPSEPSGLDDAPAPSPSAGRRLTVSRVSIEDGELVLRTIAKEDPNVHVTGFDLELEHLGVDPSAEPRVLGVSGRGELAVSQVRVKELSMREAGGSFELAGGKLAIRELELSSALGKLVLETFDVDLDDEPFAYSMSLRADALDLNGIVGATGQDALGPGRLTLRGAGLGPDPAAMKAEGALIVSAGRLPSLGPLIQLDEVFEASLVGSRYRELEVDLRVADGMLVIEPFELSSEILTLSARGSGDFTGALSFTGDAVVPTVHHGSLRVPSFVVERRAGALHYRFSLSADAVNLNRIAGVTSGPSLGPASLEATVTAEGPRPEQVAASVTLRLADGEVPSLPPIQKLDAVLDTSVGGTAYRASDIRLALSNNQIELAPFELTSGLMNLGVSGIVDLAGSVALALRVAVPRSRVQLKRKFSEDVLDGLTDESGWLGFPVHVTGTLQDPKVTPDTGAIGNAVARGATKSLRRGLERKASEQLGALLGRRTGI